MKNTFFELKKLSDYKIIVGIDLALSKSGVVIYNVPTGDIEIYRGFDPIAKLEGNERLLGLSMAFHKLFKYIRESLKIELCDTLFVYEKLPQQCGSRSSVKALQGLAMAHSVMLVEFMSNDCHFFQEGIHSTSAKAVLKKLTDKKEITKEDIKDYYENLYGKKFPSCDYSDAMAVVDTLLIKWNDYVKSSIKEAEQEMLRYKRDASRMVYYNWIKIYKTKLLETQIRRA